jgi:pyridoxine 5-phosphate synthase
MASIKLGVNVDHVATLRQARGGVEPDPVVAARVARSAGADLIVAHLRKDRRHIQEKDLHAMRKLFKRGLHLELSTDPEMIQAGIHVKPDSVCLVPEAPGEVTTQGGFDFKSLDSESLKAAVDKLQKAGIGVTLFVDPEASAVRSASALGAGGVEICTARFAEATGKLSQQNELERISLAAILARELGLELHAGHGLDYSNAAPIARVPHVSCLNIGFSIVARSMFTGLKTAVAQMKRLIEGAA